MGLGPFTATAPPSSRKAASPLVLLLGLQPGDGRRTTAITGLHFVLGAVIVLVVTPAFALFVSEFGSQRLPFAYIAIAVLVSGLNLAYLRLSNRFSFVPLSYGVLAFEVAACLALWFGLATPLRSAVIFILPVGFQFAINVTVLVVWPLAGRAFDLREAKRTFGVIAGGNWLASLLIGFLIAPLVATIGTKNLLLCAAVTAGLAMVLFGPIARAAGVWKRDAAPALARQSRRKAQIESVPLRTLMRGPVIRPLLLYIVLLWVIYYFVDNILWANAAVRYGDAEQLGAFTGRVVSIYGIVAAVMSIFLTGRILSRYGVRNALLLLPVLLTLDMAALALAGTLGASATLSLALATVGKVLVVGLGFSLSSTALTCLYQPLPPSIRGRTQALAEGVLQSLAIGLAGVLLLLFGSVFKFGAVGLAWFVVLAGLAWIVTILVIGRQYPLAVMAALRQRRLGEGPGQVLDRDALALLRPRLADESPAIVLYALNALEREDTDWPATLEVALPQLLAHPQPEVRAEALRAVARLRRADPLPGQAPVQQSDFDPAALNGNGQLVGAVTEHLKGEREPEVCAAGVEAIAALRGSAAAPFLVGFLGGEPRTETVALVALLRLAGTCQEAEARLNQLIASEFAAERVLAASVCAAAARQQDAPMLGRLLDDNDASVRRAALAAVGRASETQLWERVVAAGGRPETAEAARAALVAGGEAALTAITGALGSTGAPASDAERLQRISLAAACGRIDGRASLDLLVKQLDAVDWETRSAVCQALAARLYHSEQDGLATFEREIRTAGLLTAALVATAVGSPLIPAGPLPGGLLAELRGVRERLLLLLSFRFDPTPLLAARDALADGGEARRAYALEAVEMSLPAVLRPRMMPLVELPSAPELAARLRSAGVQVPAWDEQFALRALVDAGAETGTGAGLAGAAPWTQAAAIHHAALHCPVALPALAQVGARSPYALVRETATWAASRTGNGHEKGAQPMLSTIEKVLALKRARMFSQTPEPVLTDVARLTEELEVEAGEQVIAKGEPGDSLYIVVQGCFRVMDGARLLNELGEGDVFGELALLDPEPRMATVIALEPGRLLRLEQAPFQELIHQRPEIALGVIRVITRYLRARVQEIASLDGQPRQPASA